MLPLHGLRCCVSAADKIGSGSYGVVYKVLRKADRMVYAMKEIDLAGMSRKASCSRDVCLLCPSFPPTP